MTELLARALEAETRQRAVAPSSKDVADKLAANVDLAIAFHEGKVRPHAVAFALDIQPSGVGTWFAGTIMKGIRRGLIQIRRIE